jgi:hypothetical protein
MSLNSLKIATEGYLKSTTKVALIIAVSGYLNFQSAPPIKPVLPGGGGGGYNSSHKNKQNQQRKKQVNDLEIIAIVEFTLKNFTI